MIKKHSTKKLLMSFLFVLFVFFTGRITATSEIEQQDEVLVKESVPAEVVKTVSGRVQGESRNGVIRFLGIPYAQSIAGRNRFAPPQPVGPWTDVLQAVRYADLSPQQASDPTGESPVTPAFESPAYIEPGDDCLAPGQLQVHWLLPPVCWSRWLVGGGVTC